MENESRGPERRDERAQHPIAVVAARTGLTPDVIRVWERRYGAVEPERDEGGRRLYTDEDVERLDLLARATMAGRGIGRVAGLGMEELRALVRSDEAARWAGGGAGGGGAGGSSVVEAEGVVRRALERARALDGPGLRLELRRAATLQGMGDFLEDTVAPFFRLVGDEWHAGRLTVAQEHLASGVASRLIGELTDAVAGADGAPAMVIATPEGEYHEIGALMVAALASAEGWRVVYLGANVPGSEIAEAAAVSGARSVALSIVFVDRGAVRALVEAIRDALPAYVDLILGGQGSAVEPPLSGVQAIGDLPALRRYLSEGLGKRSLTR